MLEDFISKNIVEVNKNCFWINKMEKNIRG